jgi:hypothetical protein
MTTIMLLTLTALGAEPGGELLWREGFEDGLGAWQQAGPAEFVADPAEHRTGARAARITVAPGAELRWQQIWRSGGRAAKGDRFRAELWVRSAGVADGTGAYAALEFLDAGGQRCGIEHSAINLANGRDGWQQLAISGQAPERCASLRLNLILHAHGSAWFDDVALWCTQRHQVWPDLGDRLRRVTVHTEAPAQPRFAGVGFHVFDHVFPASETELDTVIWKRWRELNPSFARLNSKDNWTREQQDGVARWLLELKRGGTELYLATWDPQQVKPGAERAAYARRVVDMLEYLQRTKGCDNLRWYCLTNELTLGQWGSLYRDLDTFRDYHRELHAALRERGLPIGLLATDASPVGYWDSLAWAARQMDDITAIYGGHEYFTTYAPDNEFFHDWFAERLSWAVGVARAKGKEFLLGEFGSKQDGRTLNGVKQDVCAYWNTPLEPLVPLQLAETVIAALNSGVYALAYWTFMDFPDNYSRTYVNKWGAFKRSGHDYSTRPHYYAYGLLTKFCRGPATAWRVTTDDPWLRAAALSHRAPGSHTLVVVNRGRSAAPLQVDLGTLVVDQPFRKYVYDPARVPTSRFGDLQPPVGTVAARDGRLTDRVDSGCLAVYTTAYEDQPPAAVQGVTSAATPDGVRVAWHASPEPDLCYYRVFADGEQIGSTIATHWLDRGAPTGRRYRVVAVDQSGNAGA